MVFYTLFSLIFTICWNLTLMVLHAKSQESDMFTIAIKKWKIKIRYGRRLCRFRDMCDRTDYIFWQRYWENGGQSVWGAGASQGRYVCVCAFHEIVFGCERRICLCYVIVVFAWTVRWLRMQIQNCRQIICIDYNDCVR